MFFIILWEQVGCTTAFRELGVMGPSKHDKTHNTDSFCGQPVENCSDDSWCVFQIFEIFKNSRFGIGDPRKILHGSAGCRAAAGMMYADRTPAGVVPS